MIIKTKSPILYTSDCGQTFLNADGTTAPYGPFPTLPPPPPAPLKNLPPPPASQKSKNPKQRSKFDTVLDGTGRIADLLERGKNILSGKGRGDYSSSNAPQMPQTDNSSGNNDKPKGMSTGAKIGIAVGVAAVIGVIIYVAKKK